MREPVGREQARREDGGGEVHAAVPREGGDRPVEERPCPHARVEARSRLAPLTERELEVARAVGAGLSNAEISARLYLSVATVKAHVGRILDKLDADNRVQVAITVHEAELDDI